MKKFADGTIGVTINGRVHVGKPAYINKLLREHHERSKRNQQTSRSVLAKRQD